MPLEIGTQAPNFKLNTTSGEFTLSKNWAGAAGIIFFYPKDFTRECTKEVCTFRDDFSLLSELGIQVLGISQDSLDSHRKFKKEMQLPFELGVDAGGMVSSLYKARALFIGPTLRVTYLLNESHQIVAAYSNLFQGAKHVEEMRGHIKAMSLN